MEVGECLEGKGSFYGLSNYMTYQISENREKTKFQFPREITEGGTDYDVQNAFREVKFLGIYLGWSTKCPIVKLMGCRTKCQVINFPM